MTLDEYETAVQQAINAASAYYAGAGVLHLTDAEYDSLLEDIRAYEAANGVTPEHGLFDTVAAGTVVGDVSHPVPMLSLDKVTDEVGIQKFLMRVAEAGWSTRTRLSMQPKLDGMAVRAVYRDSKLVQIVTRGDGRAGEDVTERLVRPNVGIAMLPRTLPNSVPAPAHFEVRGELLMSHDDFVETNRNRMETGKTGFANPRNATAGSVRAETLEYDVRLTFVTYEHENMPAEAGTFFLFTRDLPGAREVFAEKPEEVLEAVEAFGAARADYAYPTDGVVLKATGRNVREALGAGSRAPKWAVAYKYEAQTGESIIRDIVVEVGRTGNLSFTAVFDPVFVDGSTISRASLHNIDLIADKDIRIGSKATVYKANDIIPQVLSVVNSEDTVPWVPPTEDSDGFPYEKVGKFLRSTNPADSKSALLTYAASRDVLDIDSLGRSVADALVESGLVSDLADLFDLSFNQLESMPFGESVLGETRAAKLYANVQAAKAQPLNRVITALGIRKTGRTFGRRLAAHYKSLTAFANTTRDELFQVEGVADGRADFMLEGIAANREVIGRLVAMGIDPRVEESVQDAPLAGMAVVVTGSTKGTKLEAYGRNEMNELIERHGGRASSSVSKSTSLLVAGEGAGSKLAKAESLNVRVLTPDEFADLVGL